MTQSHLAPHASTRLHFQRYFCDLTSVFCLLGSIKCFPTVKPRYICTDSTLPPACAMLGWAVAVEVCGNIILPCANLLPFRKHNRNLWDHNSTIKKAIHCWITPKICAGKYFVTRSWSVEVANVAGLLHAMITYRWQKL